MYSGRRDTGWARAEERWWEESREVGRGRGDSSPSWADECSYFLEMACGQEEAQTAGGYFSIWCRYPISLTYLILSTYTVCYVSVITSPPPLHIQYSTHRYKPTVFPWLLPRPPLKQPLRAWSVVLWFCPNKIFFNYTQVLQHCISLI